MAESCSECDAAFASAAELLEHRKKSHPDPPTGAPAEAPPAAASMGEAPPRLVCAFCGAVYHAGEPLASHLRVVHGMGSQVEVPA